MKMIDIFSETLDLNDQQYSKMDVWLKTIERDGLSMGNVINSTGGGVSVLREGNVTIGLEEGITLRNPVNNQRTIYLDPDGDAFFGRDTTQPGTTALVIFSNAQSYNGEIFGAGDLLVGDNSATQANMWWDDSAGTLKFRSGSTVAGSIGTGGIDFELGSIGGWNFNATQLYSDASEIVLDSSVPEVNVGTSKVVLDSTGITAVAGKVGGWNLASGNLYDDTTAIYLDSANAQIRLKYGTIDNDGIMLDGTNSLLRSEDWARGERGWIIEGSGNAEFYNVNIRGSLKTAVLNKGNVVAVGTKVSVTKGAGTLLTDVYFDGGTESVTLKGDEEGNATWVVSDWLYFAEFDHNQTSFASGYYQVMSSVDNLDGTFAVGLSPLLGTADFNTFYAGAAFANYGQSGDGSVEIEAGDTAGISILYNTGSTMPPATTRARLGDLFGQYGSVAHNYGVGIGDYSNGNYLAYNTDGADTFEIHSGDGAVRLDDTGIWVEGGLNFGGVNSYNFYKDGAPTVAIGYYYTYEDVSNNYRGVIRVTKPSTADSSLSLEAEANPNYEASSQLYVNSGSDVGYVKVYADSSLTFGYRSVLTLYADKIITSGGNNMFNIGGGLYVGDVTTEADDSDIWAAGDIRSAQGFMAGNTSTVPYSGSVQATKGFYSGGTGLRPTKVPAANVVLKEGTGLGYGFVFSGLRGLHLGSNLTYEYGGDGWLVQETGKSAYFRIDANDAVGGKPFLWKTDETSRTAGTAPTHVERMYMNTSGNLVTVTGGIKVGATGSFTGTGKGVEIQYNTGSDIGYIFPYDRAGSVYKKLVIRGKNLEFYEQDGNSTMYFASGHFYRNAWTTFSPPSVVGWSSRTETTVLYTRVGRLCYLMYRIAGTSNSTSCSFTLPFNEGETNQAIDTLLTRDNGSWNIGYATLNGATISFVKNASSGTTSWTASGTKAIYGRIVYWTA